MMKSRSDVHDLKTDQAPFGAIWDGSKNYEVRKDDRDFKIGDSLILRERIDGKETGRSAIARITYLTRGPDYGLPAGLVVLSIRVEVLVGALGMRWAECFEARVIQAGGYFRPRERSALPAVAEAVPRDFGAAVLGTFLGGMLASQIAESGAKSAPAKPTSKRATARKGPRKPTPGAV